MNFAPKVGPLVAEILSGFAVLLLGYFAISRGDNIPLTLHDTPAAAISIFALLAWLLGTFFDVLRNLLEHILDCFSKINWEFFFEGSPEKIANLEHYFFSFYMLDADMTIGLVAFFALGRSVVTDILGAKWSLPSTVYILIPIVAAVFALDAICLRFEIKNCIDDEKKIRQ